MTKNIRIKLGIIALILTFIVPFKSINAQVNLATCQDNWLTFISSVISYDDFTETWKDIFTRYPNNTCYYSDIENLSKQMDQARQNLRKAFYACSTNVEALTKKYYETEAELFYLRNFVDFEKSQVIKIDDEEVYQKLRSTFVLDKLYFTDDELKPLFDKFKSKYSSRVDKTYKECQDPGIKQLKDKWDQLVKTIKSMGSQTQKMAEDWNQIINTPIKRTGPFIKDNLTSRLNKLPIFKTPDQVLTQLKKDLGGSEPDIIDYQDSLAKNQEEYNKKTLEAETAAGFETKYKQSGDSIALDFEAKLKELNTTVKDTFKPIEALTECSQKTASRQCQ